MTTTNTRCPTCKSRLPRTMHFVSPSHGRETVATVIAIVSGYGGVFFVLFHAALPGNLYHWPLYRSSNLALGAVMFGLWLAIDGLLTSTLIWWWERHHPPPEPRDNVTYSYDQEMQLGDGIRAVTTRDGQRQWLRERGFVVAPEVERGALSKWCWAIVDGRVTFSQRGARTVLTNNDRTRQWAMDIMALFCQAGWASPSAGWNGDEPDLSNGVSDVDEDIIAACASGGYAALIDRLTALVDASVEPPPPNDGNE